MAQLIAEGKTVNRACFEKLGYEPPLLGCPQLGWQRLSEMQRASVQERRKQCKTSSIGTTDQISILGTLASSTVALKKEATDVEGENWNEPCGIRLKLEVLE